MKGREGMDGGRRFGWVCVAFLSIYATSRLCLHYELSQLNVRIAFFRFNTWLSLCVKSLEIVIRIYRYASLFTVSVFADTEYMVYLRRLPPDISDEQHSTTTAACDDSMDSFSSSCSNHSSSSDDSSSGDDVSNATDDHRHRLARLFHAVDRSTSVDRVQYDVNKLIKLATRHPAKSFAFLWLHTTFARGSDAADPTEREAKQFERDVNLIRAAHNHSIRQASRRVRSLHVVSGSKRTDPGRRMAGKERREWIAAIGKIFYVVINSIIAYRSQYGGIECRTLSGLCSNW